MDIKNINLSRLRNAEHVQYHSDFTALVERYSAAKLGIDHLFSIYKKQLEIEQSCFSIVEKSATTEEINTADLRRDNAFRGIKGMVKAHLYHFKPELVEVAKRLKIIFDTYGNVPASPYDEETAQITSIVSEFTTSYRDEIATLELTEWVGELKAANEQFKKLKTDRYKENAAKSDIKMKDIRSDVDSLYEEMERMVSALMIINGEDKYRLFVKELNARIESYNLSIAKKGKKGSKDDVGVSDG